MTRKWRPTGGGNAILEYPDFMLSYNPDAGAGLLTFLVPMMAEATGRDEAEYARGPETAIILMEKGKRGDCLVLKGDHREALAHAAEHGRDAVLAEYEVLRLDHSSPWSEDQSLDP